MSVTTNYTQSESVWRIAHRESGRKGVYNGGIPISAVTLQHNSSFVLYIVVQIFVTISYMLSLTFLSGL